MLRRATTDALIARVLGDEYLSLRVVHYQVAEYVEPGSACRVTLTVETGAEERETVEGRGVGFVDAIYRGLMQHFARAFASLSTVTFTRFAVQGRMETGRLASGLDAEVGVELVVSNANGRPITFRAADRSTLAAAVAAVVRLVEHFVNAERAYVCLHRALADAEARERPDLVEQYTAELAELCNTTSYEAISARVRVL